MFNGTRACGGSQILTHNNNINKSLAMTSNLGIGIASVEPALWGEAGGQALGSGEGAQTTVRSIPTVDIILW